MTLAGLEERIQIRVDFLPQSASNRPGTRIVPSYITIHNTDNGGTGANAAAHAKYLRGAEAKRRQVSWHYTVDDGEVVKNLPTNEMGWHAGTHAGNLQSVGIEICENKGIDQAAANDRAALLTALLMHILDIPKERVVPHHFWSGKNCPHLLLDEEGAWPAFVKKAAAYATMIEG